MMPPRIRRPRIVGGDGGGQVGVVVDNQQGVVGGAQVAQGDGQRQLFALVPQFVPQLQHPGAAVESRAGDVQRGAPAGNLRVNDDIEAADAVRLLPAEGAGDAGGGIIQGAAQLQGGIGGDGAVGLVAIGSLAVGLGIVGLDDVQEIDSGGGHRQRILPAAGAAGIQGRRPAAGQGAVQPADFAAHQSFGQVVRCQQGFQAAVQGRQQPAGGGGCGGFRVRIRVRGGRGGHKSSPFGVAPLRAASMDWRTESGIATPCRSKAASTLRPMLRGSR